VVAWTVQGFILSLIGAVILSLGFAYLTKRRV
jgi:LPXTG-motif cell wall-anchored protein